MCLQQASEVQREPDKGEFSTSQQASEVQIQCDKSEFSASHMRKGKNAVWAAMRSYDLLQFGKTKATPL